MAQLSVHLGPYLRNLCENLEWFRGMGRIKFVCRVSSRDPAATHPLTSLLFSTWLGKYSSKKSLFFFLFYYIQIPGKNSLKRYELTSLLAVRLAVWPLAGVLTHPLLRPHDLVARVARVEGAVPVVAPCTRRVSAVFTCTELLLHLFGELSHCMGPRGQHRCGLQIGGGQGRTELG